VAYIGTAISKDSVPGASVFDGGFILIYIFFGGLILGALWFALLSFRSAFRPPPRETSYSPPVPAQQPLVAAGATTDE